MEDLANKKHNKKPHPHFKHFCKIPFMKNQIDEYTKK